jgi:hypothetical protein
MVSQEEKKIEELEDKTSNDDVCKSINECNQELEKIGVQVSKLNIQISEKTVTLEELQSERDELVKKSLMMLHSTLKKEHQRADKEHARYVELYTQERAKKHEIERKMMNLKMMVYQNYGLRLV